MTERKPFRAGDIVTHLPTGEIWQLATDEDHGRVLPQGWPETLAEASDCSLKVAATDVMRLRALRDAARSGEGRGGGGYRSALARSQLHAIDDDFARDVDATDLEHFGRNLAMMLPRLAKARERHGRDFVRAREHGELLDALDGWAQTRKLRGS